MLKVPTYISCAGRRIIDRLSCCDVLLLLNTVSCLLDSVIRLDLSVRDRPDLL
jgi:hypothetical protein